MTRLPTGIVLTATWHHPPAAGGSYAGGGGQRVMAARRQHAGAGLSAKPTPAVLPKPMQLAGRGHCACLPSKLTSVGRRRWRLAAGGTWCRAEVEERASAGKDVKLAIELNELECGTGAVS